MSDLETFRDHARHMADAQHRPDCPPRDQRPRHVNTWDSEGRYAGSRYDPPRCAGCVTSTDRSLWARLADEADAWLNSQSEEALPI